MSRGSSLRSGLTWDRITSRTDVVYLATLSARKTGNLLGLPTPIKALARMSSPPPKTILSKSALEPPINAIVDRRNAQAYLHRTMGASQYEYVGGLCELQDLVPSYPGWPRMLELRSSKVLAVFPRGMCNEEKILFRRARVSLHAWARLSSCMQRIAAVPMTAPCIICMFSTRVVAMQLAHRRTYSAPTNCD